jgi:Cof subfamily protein (haloacid dehalogenase superfamily)
MKKTLFISDLDGTLLNGGAEMSPFTKTELRRLVSAGANIGFATARTTATALRIVTSSEFNVPSVLMNGVAVYDLTEKRYVNVEYICGEAKERLIGTIIKHGLGGFLYAISDGEHPNLGGLSSFYAKADTEAAKTFIREREKKFGKYFTRVDSFTACIGEKAVFYSIADDKEKLLPALEEFRKTPGLNTDFYVDSYNTDHYYLEVCSDAGSKYNAVKFVREYGGFEHVVGFGDNLNDIPLFKACDESYAVENAHPDLKALATAVIPSNEDDGVVKKIAELYDLCR